MNETITILPEGRGKVVLIITGAEDKGKTASVKGIFKYFDALPGRKVVCPYPRENTEKPREIKSVLEIDGMKIGFESEGDPGSRLVTEKLKDQLAEGCDLIVCAARTGLSKPHCRPLIEILEELETRHPEYRIICVSNYEDQEDKPEQGYCDSLNDLFVEAAIKLIKRLFPKLP